MRSFLVATVLICSIPSAFGQSYIDYHQDVIRCEQFIAEKKITEARQVLDSLFNQFGFIFLREYKLATELSIYQHDYESAFNYLRLGALGGWTMKRIKKNKNLTPLKKNPRWKEFKAEYDSLNKVYWSKLNIPLRKEAKQLLKGDQKIALGVFIRVREKSRIKHTQKKFIPYSEKTLARIETILNEYGYPGEKLIGNSWWTSVNLSHHNSSSYEYVKKDTMYQNLRPLLLESISRGELHPNEFAIIEDWKNAALTQHGSSLYGFLGEIPDNSNLQKVNQNRNQLGLRSIALRNELLKIEKETGLNLYLPKDWQKGEIAVSVN